MSDKKLTLEELNYVQKEVANNTKSLLSSYSLAIFLGSLGIHRAYFGKKKTAIIKSVITFLGGVNLGLIVKKMATIDLSSELTLEVLTANATLAVPFLTLFLIGFGWYLVDLFLIPKWKRNWDEETKEKATVEVVQGRYVSAQLLRELLSEELVQDAKEQAVDKIEEILLNLNSEELHQLSHPSIPNLPKLTEEEIAEIRKEIARLESEIEKYELVKKKLAEKAKEAKKAKEAEEARLAEEAEEAEEKIKEAEEKLKEEQEKSEDKSLKGELESAEQTPDDIVSDESITEEEDEELVIEKQDDNSAIEKQDDNVDDNK